MSGIPTSSLIGCAKYSRDELKIPYLVTPFIAQSLALPTARHSDAVGESLWIHVPMFAQPDILRIKVELPLTIERQTHLSWVNQYGVYADGHHKLSRYWIETCMHFRL